MNLKELQQVWSIPGPWSSRAIEQGANNRTQEIETPAGIFILRRYPDDRSLEHIRFELGVLRRLQESGLPFQVPVPVPTAAGELYAVLSGTAVTLTPLLPGSSPRGDDLEQAGAAGQVLAELSNALANISGEISPQAMPFPPQGDFTAWAGTTMDPANQLQELALDSAEKEQAFLLMEEMQAAAPILYHSLPQQIIHRDYDPSNVLMDGSRVTGVLDFEFCGYDLRILDLAYTLTRWPDGLWNTGGEWPVIDAFVRGYLRRQKLTREELEALPLVFRLRAACSLFYRLGRYSRSLETPESLGQRIHKNLEIVFWLEAHGEELKSYLLTLPTNGV